MVHPSGQVFDSLEAAERSDHAYHAAFSPQARLDLLLEIVAREAAIKGSGSA